MLNFYIDTLKELDEYTNLLRYINERESPIISSGIITENMGQFVYGLNQHLNRQVLLVTYDEIRSRKLYEDILNIDDSSAILYPKKEIIPYDIDAHSNERTNSRLKVLYSLASNRKNIVVTSIDGLIDKVISKYIIKSYIFHIDYDTRIDLNEISNLFIKGGYERVNIIEGIGQFSIRGGILDFFPPTEDNPIRIELFDDEIDSIRTFDKDSQRSIDNLDQVTIVPFKDVLIEDSERDNIINGIEVDLKKLDRSSKVKEIEKEKVKLKFNRYIEKIREKMYISNTDMLIPYIEEEKINSVLDYLDSEALIFLDDPRRIDDRLKNLEEDNLYKFRDLFEIGEVLSSYENIFYDKIELDDKFLRKNLIKNSSILSGKSGSGRQLVNFTVKQGEAYHNQLDLLARDLSNLRKSKYRIILFGGTEDRAKGLSKALKDRGIENNLNYPLENQLLDSQVVVLEGSLDGGFEYPDIKLKVISDIDIFGNQKRKGKKHKRGSKTTTFVDLNIGDYVVHENHGIGQYEGVERLDIQGIKKDYLTIKYKGADKLYVPIDQMNLIQKYIGAESIKPKVNKLSSAEWAKSKQKAKKIVEDMAKDLLELYAKRESGKGFQFDPDNEWQRQFEDYFPYEETEGQMTSIIEIKEDMEKIKPMDRLLCGDVGYGKTEVALRAAFKAVLSGKQVAVLVPTTILAQQHYNNMVRRFQDFPVKISVLSRFRTKAQQNLEIEALRRGEVDIVVGTHRLISKDVVFKDLGLLIIDEEQRFGVKHKERLKQLKSSIDVLTLTATPIPRTLHMSLSGIRDMSVIEDPPEERFPVQTYVMEFNDQVVREAILKEVGRGGQVYFVYNRVGTIDSFTSFLRELVPEAKFGIGHGQMDEKKLEKVMLDFYEKEFDVLVCTTIIETGLDIPNVNTIIINDADKLGLSQLYQLRGRVGRSNRIAYGYFLYERDKVLSEVAEKRLRAIKEFTEFGSGFKIAMRDLEIRGAGNLLGVDQHGQIEAIGYDLYVKFLNESIMKLKGQVIEEKIDTTIDLKVNGFIKNSYIEDEEIKIDIYKKIADIWTKEEYLELLDELIDRFGDIPLETENLMDISYIRSIGSRNNVITILEKGKEILVEFHKAEKIDPDMIDYLKGRFGRRISFNIVPNPNLKYKYKDDMLKELKEVFEAIDDYSKKYRVVESDVKNKK